MRWALVILFAFGAVSIAGIVFVAQHQSTWAEECRSRGGVAHLSMYDAPLCLAPSVTR